ncbi:hypothetical protein [Thermocoleostomius sinensis]|jgi:Zn-finger protein|uniref:Uncharacterized protein n=1 Tax=Thermocoleostomius sinensis A174 TaxID=2016057 RepID=A0A9E8Z8F0_9CYAN|nr:hypothetical protein [Thermocoleostomius sinensis]WAL58393.1 hypothetical protein OXH18_14505 [Thermocoleostomius sinensis A174]
MKIVWEQSIYVGNAPVFCSICGCQSYPVRNQNNQLLLAVIYNKQGVALGEACRDCVASGSVGIRSRLEERIQSLQAKIAELQTLAETEIQTPSLEQEFQAYRRDTV